MGFFMHFYPPYIITAVAVDDQQTLMMCIGSWLLQRVMSEGYSQFSQNSIWFWQIFEDFIKGFSRCKNVNSLLEFLKICSFWFLLSCCPDWWNVIFREALIRLLDWCSYKNNKQQTTTEGNVEDWSSHYRSRLGSCKLESLICAIWFS